MFRSSKSKGSSSNEGYDKNDDKNRRALNSNKKIRSMISKSVFLPTNDKLKLAEIEKNLKEASINELDSKFLRDSSLKSEEEIIHGSYKYFVDESSEKKRSGHNKNNNSSVSSSDSRLALNNFQIKPENRCLKKGLPSLDEGQIIRSYNSDFEKPKNDKKKGFKNYHSLKEDSNSVFDEKIEEMPTGYILRSPKKLSQTTGRRPPSRQNISNIVSLDEMNYNYYEDEEVTKKFTSLNISMEPIGESFTEEAQKISRKTSVKLDSVFLSGLKQNVSNANSGGRTTKFSRMKSMMDFSDENNPK